MEFRKIKNKEISTEGDKKLYKETLLIDNDKYGMFYVTKNVNNRVILFLHGGPGSPEYIFFQSQIKSLYLDDFYTVCYMEQRGSGMLFEGKRNITTDILVEDIKKFSIYLCKKFKQEKLVLMGHSWGTYLGMRAVNDFPELFSCYIGISQLCNIKESERDIYQYFIQELNKINDTKHLEKLIQYDMNAQQFPQLKYLQSVKTKILKKLNVGLTRKPLPKNMFFKQLLSFKGYTINEKFGLLGGMICSRKVFMDEVRNLKIDCERHKIKIPILIIHGKFDYQVSMRVSQNLFSNVQAPLKEYAVFNKSAHFPHFEEAKLFTEKISSYIMRVELE